jgi:cyclopropane fatty-acyl-phospholipid synthase-like methyltransferase
MDLEALNKISQDAWNQIAEYWDEKMGEGNQFQRILVAPATERLLELKPGEHVLEIACGNGVFTRCLAQLGAQVIATDFSHNLLKQAKKGQPNMTTVSNIVSSMPPTKNNCWH